jgi:quercetin dioxygenase-like cupin family protein
MTDSEATYEVERRVTVAEAPNLRVRELALSQGQCVPWHYHTNITDTFFCMEGPVLVCTRNPDARHVLQPGGKLSVYPGTPHRVTGLDDGPCRFMIVQGVGAYDYVPAET